MKSFLAAAAFGIISTWALSAHAQNTPTLMVDVYQVINNEGQPVSDRTVRHHQQNHQLCWLVQGLDVAAGTQSVYEHIVSAAPTQFADASAFNARSPNGTHHYINGARTIDNNGNIQKCWRFDGTEPVGDYSIYVRIGDWEFPTQTFSVAP